VADAVLSIGKYRRSTIGLHSEETQLRTSKTGLGVIAFVVLFARCKESKQSEVKAPPKIQVDTKPVEKPEPADATLKRWLGQ
jgi:hypothetical protein